MPHSPHQMFRPHHERDGWKFTAFGIAAGILIAIALSYAMAAA